MSNWQIPEGLSGAQTFNVNLAASEGVMLTSGGANAKGSWVELGTTEKAGEALWLSWGAMAIHPNTDFLLDIGIGPAGSETLVIENFLVSLQGGTYASGIIIPVHVPAGVRLAARCQAMLASAKLMLQTAALQGGPMTPPGFRKAEAIGINAGTTEGVIVDPGATLNTKSAWYQITASAARSYAGFLICIGAGQANANKYETGALFDIAFGNAGAEVPVLENLQVGFNNTIDGPAPSEFGPVHMAIPTGTRIAVRGQSNVDGGGIASNRNFGVSLLGLVQ